MLFSSLTFLYYFLPTVLLLYFLSPKHLKNITLLLFSFIFYAWGEPKFVVLMVLSILSGFVFAILIEKPREKSTKLARLLLTASVVCSIIFLLYFKYTNFFISNINTIFKCSLPLLKVTLPIGISFYTFQILSYTVDVYRGDVKAQRNFIDLATYISFFPQLIAGPIVRYSDIEKELSNRTHSFEKVGLGIKCFIIGLSKKIILANTLGELCEKFTSSSDKSVLFYWIYIIAFMLQIYFDFSGYSDMAIGLGKILGFNFPQNFNYPFFASSITDFWRRWHMTLGSWFKDYVYIPLGGSKCAKPRMLFNILVVWMLTGFWHGATWNFILWGLYFAILLTAEKFLWLDFIKKTRIIKHIYVLFLVTLSFVIFSSKNLNETLSHLSSMFGASDLPFSSAEFLFYFKNYAITLLADIVFSLPTIGFLKRKLLKNEKAYQIYEFLKIPFLLILLIICTAFLADGSFNPFLYFRF